MGRDSLWLFISTPSDKDSLVILLQNGFYY